MSPKAVVDASVVMAALLPREPTRPAARRILERYVEDELELLAPTLLPYELANGLLKAERRRERKVATTAVDEILEKLRQLDIPLEAVSMEEAVALARRYDRSAYDAAYLALAEREEVPLITADKRLFNAVKRRFQWIAWVEEFR
jgi:predicted nucleic acid-binding protein